MARPLMCECYMRHVVKLLHFASRGFALNSKPLVLEHNDGLSSRVKVGPGSNLLHLQLADRYRSVFAF